MVLVRNRPLLPDVVRSELRRAIIEGEFPPGSRLPNEEALCVRFGVSRITLREAVRGLIEDGYVIRRQGAGTFVTSGPVLRNSLDTNFSYTEYLESTGIKVSKKVLEAATVEADDAVIDDLALPAGSKVVEIKRVRIAGRKPAIYSIDNLPTDIADHRRDLKAFSQSLYRLLASRGHDVDHARTILTPVIATRELAEILNVPAGTPLQHLKQIDFDSAGRPVMRSLEWHVPSVIELRVYRRGPGPIALGSGNGK
ncbi:MAG TPA: GntR family transcriptional regulator [Devosia sp.]|jgi:DNA-binding GntR family transcriptional regulator|nr:GntR family transcriptional regulator [Devosia sp.]